MKTLYIRIVLTFVLITLISGIVALLLTNVYYVAHIREYNDKKLLTISNEIRTLYEQMPEVVRLDDYFNPIANMGFQLYVVNERMESAFYGAPFKHQEIDLTHIQSVLDGNTYNGVMEKRPLFVTEYFENSIRNSIGFPLMAQGERYAVFVRPNLEQQIGEVRMLLAILLSSGFLFSIALIVILTRSIVKPVKQLTIATTKIVGGDYNMEMDVQRQDEIGNLARHFKHMAQSLQRLDEMRQQFVANVSHEIQSPLTSIQGFAQSIIDEQASPDEQRRYLHIIAEESRRLSALSKQLLTLASLDKEADIVKPITYRLDEQIRQAMIVTEWQWSEGKLEIELDLDEVTVTADPQLLVQVWLNLITNSIKFCRPGDTISIRLQADRDIVVSVSDTGVGISDTELPHIFDRFYKADKARNRSRSGSGLGLSIAKKIIDLHRGAIEVQSELGKGTTFTVRLPRT